MMLNTIYAALTFYDFEYDPDMITAELGLSPTRVRRIGDAIFVKQNSWQLRSTIESISLDEHVRDVLAQIEPRRAAVRESCLPHAEHSFSVPFP